jgi:hypothetical protein
MTTLHLFNIPEDDAILPGWLEAQLAGPYLGELVAELEVLQEADQSFRTRSQASGSRDDQERTLESLFGNRLPQVGQRGLTNVPAAVLRRLFRNPRLLLELQHHVLTEGSSYWDQKLEESEELTESASAGWTRLTQEPDTNSPARPSIRPSVRPQSSDRATTAGTPMRWYFSGFATAAAIAAGVFLVQDRFPGRPPLGQQPVAASGWGWSKPGALPSGVTRDRYLNALADAAHQWRNKRPDTPQELAKRINEFRQGCSTLILADHKPLPPPDQKWLVDKCGQWAKKLDNHLADLEGGKSPPVVRDAVDQTVDKLEKALRDRADHPAAA